MRHIKLFENMEKAKSIISKKMEAFDKLKDLLKNNLGYIGKFTEYLMDENIPYNELESLYKDLIRVKGKGRSIDLSDLNYEKALDEIIRTDDDLFVKSVINKFPSDQKKMINDIIFFQGIGIIKRLKEKDLTPLISKISRYKNKEDLTTALKIFSKDSDNGRDSVLNYASKSESCSVSFSNENILIIRVQKIEDLKKLGSDTSWCILHDSMWNSYTKNRYQFILFDYTKDELNKEFKIGFTLNKDLSIHAAHDILDGSYKYELINVLEREGAKISNLVKQTPIEDVDISNIKINNKTTLKDLQTVIDNTPRSGKMLLIRKMLDISLTDSKKSMVRDLIKSYYSDYSVVTNKTLMEHGGKTLVHFCENNGRDFSTFINPDIIKWGSIDNAILGRSMDLYNDKPFTQIQPGYLLNYNHGFKFNDDNIRKIYNRLSKIVNTIKDKGDKIGAFQTMIIIDRALGINKIPLSEIDGVDDGDFKVVYSDILKLPIDSINFYYPRSFEFLIEKDYSDINLNNHNFSLVGLLLEKLKNQNLQFIIDRILFNTIKGYNRKTIPLSYRTTKTTQKSEDLKKDLSELIKTFPKLSKKGESVSNGKWTVHLELDRS